MTYEVAQRMADAATALLASLDATGRSRTGWRWPGDPESDAERRRWFYTPTDHGGLTVGEMSPTQYRRTMALVASGLSPAGYITVSTVMGLENALDYTEGFAGPALGGERARDPGRYYVRVFGEPGSRIWGWRFGGHHVSLNNLVVDGEVAACTPCFLGADPATAPLLGATLRPLAGVEDAARELVRSLSADQLHRALLTPRAPVDIVGGNRTRVLDGPQRVLPLSLIWRDTLEPELGQLMRTMHDRAEQAAGITEADHEAIELRPQPTGIAARELDPGQRELLTAVLDRYTARVPAELDAGRPWADDGPAGRSGLDAVHFAWAGETEPGQPHYYRLQGPRLLVEYDNTQRQVNHAHSVWRDPENDFGADVLAAHLGGPTPSR